jgi:hypothetical protein
VESVPRKILEGNNNENYKRIFKAQPSDEIVVLNSVVIDYAWRLGVVTTDDWEFELIAPTTWVSNASDRFYLQKDDSDSVKSEINRVFQKPIRPWYAINDIDKYELYRDATSRGYVYMLVSKMPIENGKYHIFISKH